MPNYIKNRIELAGSTADIETLIEKFSTHFEKKPSVAIDGELIYKNAKTCEVGWLDQKTNIFKRRKTEDVEGVPDGFEQNFDEAWTRFPDFDKIVPMPKGLEANPHSGIQIWIEICTGQIDFKSGNDMSEMGGIIESMKKTSAIRALTEGRNLLTFSDEELELFVQGVKNFRQYGFISWYEWSIQNWGTKWNTSECRKIADNVFEFETAWSGVPALIQKMSVECPNVKIIYKYSDEDTGHNCGVGEYLNGEIRFTELEGGSKEAYDLAFELRPDIKSDYKLVGNKYKYIETE